MYGLYSALTDGSLAAYSEAVAQGNGLGKGPLVFELYRSGVDLIRQQAAGASPVQGVCHRTCSLDREQVLWQTAKRRSPAPDIQLCPVSQQPGMPPPPLVFELHRGGVDRIPQQATGADCGVVGDRRARAPTLPC